MCKANAGIVAVFTSASIVTGGSESTYGLDFDPRNFDQTEPYFYLGRVRTYPQYWVDGQCPPGQAN